MCQGEPWHGVTRKAYHKTESLASNYVKGEMMMSGNEFDKRVKEYRMTWYRSYTVTDQAWLNSLVGRIGYMAEVLVSEGGKIRSEDLINIAANIREWAITREEGGESE